MHLTYLAAAAALCAASTLPASAAPADRSEASAGVGWSPYHRQCPHQYARGLNDADWQPPLQEPREAAGQAAPRATQLLEVRWLPEPNAADADKGQLQCTYGPLDGKRDEALVLLSRFQVQQPTAGDVWTAAQTPKGALVCDPRLPDFGVMPRCAVMVAPNEEPHAQGRKLPF